MGHNDHIDLNLLDDLEEAIGYGILDSVEDAELIAAIKAVAEEVESPEQLELFKNSTDWLNALDEEHTREEIEYRLAKDD